MMIGKHRFALLATSTWLALSLGSIGPVLAQDQSGTNIDTGVTGGPGSATTFAMAQDLYAIGVANKDALIVLTAAKLAASVPLTEGETEEIDPARVDLTALAQTPLGRDAGANRPAPVIAAPQAEVGVGKVRLFEATSSDEGDADGPIDAAAMLAMATELAGEDETLLGLIDDIGMQRSRGRIGGAINRRSGLPAGMTDVWEVPFFGGSFAEVAVIGDGDTTLDVLVTDENGNTVCYEASGTDKVACDFVPAWNGYFYVTVQNPGAKQNTYYLMTN